MNALDFLTSLGKNTSLRKKILVVILVASNSALLIASMAVLLVDWQSARSTVQQEMKVLASVISQRSAASITFQDTELAEENLHALSEKYTVMSACIYSSNDELFAAYYSDQAGLQCQPDAPRINSGFIEDRYIEKRDIMLNGYRVGSLYIKTSLADINKRLFINIIIVSIIFICAGFIAFYLAIKLQKIITRPIDELAEAARKIHQDKSYGIRVRKVTNDEIGHLVLAFNDMLDGIEQRDAMLVDAKKNLEEIVRDRTAALRDAQNELIRKDRMATLGQLTATVSHELRNPLGTIRTSVFTLSNRLKITDDSIKHIIDRIDRNIVRCDSIITELLDYSRIRAMQHQKTHLATWIRSLVDDVIVPDDVNVLLQLDNLLEVAIDRDLYRRVLINVIDNASQAMQNMAVSGKSKTITIESRMLQGKTEVIVKDNGPGISPDILPRIFDPLFSTKSFGIGLGLSVVRQIMIQHGGNVDVMSEENVGTQVVLWMPSDLAVVDQHIPANSRHGY